MQSTARTRMASHNTLIRSTHITLVILIVVTHTALTILIVVLYGYIIYGAHNTQNAAGLALKHMLHTRTQYAYSHTAAGAGVVFSYHLVTEC
jgi:hypothetical protein